MSPDLADVAEIYSRQPKLKKQDVEKVSEWTKTQPHLPEITELQVILFLHSCRYDSEEAKVTIESYFTLRTGSDIFQSGHEELIKRCLAAFFVGMLPKKTPEGSVIFLGRMVDPIVEKFVCVDICKVAIMAICLHFHKHGPSNGLLVLCDFKDIAFGHLFRMSVRATRQFLLFLQGAAPTRLKGFHYVNTSPVTKHFKMFLKPFLKREIYDSIKFHSESFDSLYEWIPRDCLPEEYGGELGPFEQLREKNQQTILDNLEFFRWHDSQLIDESKRSPRRGFFGNIGNFFR